MEQLPVDIYRNVADSFLNPADRSRLSRCNHFLRELFPRSLRIKIVSSRGDGCLQPEFFVSPADDLEKTIYAQDHLVYGKHYVFWTFDYNRGNKVYLGRHTRHGHKADSDGNSSHLYCLGLRPKRPNQFWEFIGGDAGDAVMWGEDVKLAVGGDSPCPRLPDSKRRGFLSCLTSTTGQHRWCILKEEDGDHMFTESENIQLVPCDEFVPGEDVAEKELIVHAIAEVCDDGEYLLHTPESCRDGNVATDGYHAVVNFKFWVNEGVMHFLADSMPFTLHIPILETDGRAIPPQRSPLSSLLVFRSARWGCVIYYMAVAADVSEGKRLDMNRFLTRVTDHPDHKVVYNGDEETVYIDVKNKAVERYAPSLEKDEETWKFILCW